jgi:hypothetical protein
LTFKGESLDAISTSMSGYENTAEDRKIFRESHKKRGHWSENKRTFLILIT